MGVTIRSEYRHFRVCRKLVVGLLLSIMITSLTIQNASADPAIRYVATTGSNAGNNCTDIENPCLTITPAHAASLVVNSLSDTTAFDGNYTLREAIQNTNG